MSKKHYSNKSRTATKSGGVGVVVKFVAILLALLGVAYVITSLALNKQWNPLKWGKKVEATQPDDGGNSGNGDQKEPVDDLVNAGENKGILLKSRRLAASEFEANGIDAQANTAYSVTATVNEDAVDKSVIGSVSWKNSSSTWASGKNIADYVTLNQTEQYGLNFTLTVKQAFGEPIMIKVASCMDSGVYGTAQVDYLKDLISFTGYFDVSSEASRGIFLDGRKKMYRITPEWGVGTVWGDIRLVLHLSLNQYSVDTLNARLKQNSNTSGYTVKSRILLVDVYDGFVLTPDVETFLDGTGNAEYAKIILNNFFVEKGVEANQAIGSPSVQAGLCAVRAIITYTYGDEYSVKRNYSAEDTTLFRKDNLTTMATINDINLTPDHIVAVPDVSEETAN